MNTYIMRIEGIDAAWPHLKARSGVECIKNFFRDNPSLLRKNGTHLTLERLPMATKMRYAVSGNPPKLRIMMYTRLDNDK